MILLEPFFRSRCILPYSEKLCNLENSLRWKTKSDSSENIYSALMILTYDFFSFSLLCILCGEAKVL